MRKKLLTFLVAVFCLIPCLFLSACNDDSMSENKNPEPEFSAYTVTFDYGDAINYFDSAIEQTTVKSAEWITNLPTIKEEYENSFKGWYITGTDKKIENYDFVGGNVILEAKFEANENAPAGLYQDGKLVKNWSTLKEENSTAITNTEIFGNGISSYFTGLNGELVIDSSIIVIGRSAFKNCSGLIGITLSNSVTTIGVGISDDVFNGCIGLTNITIPNSVTSISLGAFSDCKNLESIIVTDGNSVYHSAGNCLIETVSKELIAGCKTSVIPTDGSVTSIGSDAFSGCIGLTDITIPSSVSSIGVCAFSGCIGLTDITVPNSVTSMGYAAFLDCSNLNNVSIMEGVTNIGPKAFENCESLTNITIPSSVTSIDYQVFAGCSGLQSITVASGNSVYHSEENCLIETSSKTLVAGCKTSVIPTDGSVTSIGEYAFDGCTSLTNIIIPNSVTSIENTAFYNCSGLESIVVEVGNSVYHSSGNCLIETASKTLILGCKTSVIPTDGSVTSIASSAFRGCTGLTNITIPGNITSIGYSTFSGCTGLTSVTIEEGVTSIGYSAFYGCTSLTSIIIPNSVSGIADYAFGDCSSLNNITIPSSVASIGEFAFSGCSNLSSVTFENTSGWFVATNSSATSGTDIDVADASINATNLTSTYNNYYWKRNG